MAHLHLFFFFLIHDRNSNLNSHILIFEDPGDWTHTLLEEWGLNILKVQLSVIFPHGKIQAPSQILIHTKTLIIYIGYSTLSKASCLLTKKPLWYLGNKKTFETFSEALQALRNARTFDWCKSLVMELKLDSHSHYTDG